MVPDSPRIKLKISSSDDLPKKSSNESLNNLLIPAPNPETTPGFLIASIISKASWCACSPLFCNCPNVSLDLLICFCALFFSYASLSSLNFCCLSFSLVIPYVSSAYWSWVAK